MRGKQYEKIPTKAGFLYGVDLIFGSDHHLFLDEAHARDAIFKPRKNVT